MKKLILVFATIAITTGAYAQIDSTNNTISQRTINKNQNTHKESDHKSSTDGVVMKDGKMMRLKDGKLTSLGNDMTMSNGTKIKSDGSYTKKDGKKMMLKEGQHIDMSGNMTYLKTGKDSNMYLLPDSTRK